jgi:hydrogenase maturation protease
MRPILVIACGNPLRGDDGVAWEVARALGDSALAAGGGEIEILAVHQLTPELADGVSRAETVIFVDAGVDAGARAGEILLREVEVESAAASAIRSEISHSVGPAELMAVAREIYARAPANAFLLTINGGAFEICEMLSEPARRAIPRAVEEIETLCRHFLRVGEFAR